MARRFSRRRDHRSKRANEHRINEDIRIPEVRLVGDNLDELSEMIGQPVESGVFRTNIVRDWANEMGLDLVEIAPKANPPVVRIIDYNKFLYNKKKKEKEIKSRAARTVIKVIRYRSNTDDHEFNFKLKHDRSFLEEGAKVRAYVHFRCRRIVFKERGELLLLRFLKELEDYGTAESLPKLSLGRLSAVP